MKPVSRFAALVSRSFVAINAVVHSYSLNLPWLSHLLLIGKVADNLIPAAVMRLRTCADPELATIKSSVRPASITVVFSFTGWF